MFGRSKFAEAARADAAVVFFDYHGLSRYADRLSTDDSVRFLLDYYKSLGDAVFASPAKLVKLFGDQVAVVCGMPDRVASPSGLAVALAFSMRAAFRQVAARWGMEGLVPMTGIDAGPLVGGHFGHPKHYEFMVMGEPVRIAQQASACALEGQILATARAIVPVRERVRAKEFTAIRIRSGGTEREVAIHEIEGWR